MVAKKKTCKLKIIMIKKIFVYVILILLFSCQQEKKEREIPENLIQREQMIELLIDIHMTDAILINHRIDNKEEKY